MKYSYFLTKCALRFLHYSLTFNFEEVLSFYIYIYIHIYIYIYIYTQCDIKIVIYPECSMNKIIINRDKFTKLKIYDHETTKCSKGIWESGNEKKTNIRKYFLKKNI